ncbi:MAG: nicotinamide mononucleotide transporter family protein [Flavobacteriales bacterium]
MGLSKLKSLLRQFVQSEYLDIFSAILILGVTLWRGFHRTVYFNETLQFNIPFHELGNYMLKGAFPIGIFSIIGAVFSIMATRLVGKQNNWGNFIAVVTTISSGVIDYMFGNHSAILTYPLTFLIHSFASYNWNQGEKIRKMDFWYAIIVGGGLSISFGIVYLGFYFFGGNNTLYLWVSLIFGLSIGANIANALKYEETWLSWMIYNFLQLIKAVIQLNLANIVKYVFYLFNALFTFLDWKLNGDITKKSK